MAKWREPTYNEKRQQKMKIKHELDKDTKMAEILPTAMRGLRPSVVIIDELNERGSIGTLSDM